MLEFNQTPVQKLLCLCIRHCDYLDTERIIQSYRLIGDDLLFREAKLNGVASIVAHALMICFGEDNVPNHWVKEYRSVSTRISRYMAELKKVARLLSDKKIKLVALKNSGITIGLYPYFGACPMGDVDVLVSKNDFIEAHKMLTSSGYQLKFRCALEEESIDAALKGGGAEYSVTLENGEHLWFELQWRPVAGRWIQPQQEPDAGYLIERSLPLEESWVRILAPEDNLLQVSLHTAKHTFVRAPGFRLHTDVDRIVSSQKIDWEFFLDRVKTLHTRTAVFFSLAMSRSLLGTPVPDQVLKDLHPGALKTWVMKAWLERVGIFEPDSPKWSRLGYIVFVSLLYDSFFDFMQGIIPSNADMKRRYDFDSNWLLVYYHLIRLRDLLFRRVNT